MIRIANNALENCTNVEQVVELCNDEFATDASPELIAAAYAIDAAEFTDDMSDREVLEHHLDFLTEAGANFDYQKALKEAIEDIKNDKR